MGSGFSKATSEYAWIQLPFCWLFAHNGNLEVMSEKAETNFEAEEYSWEFETRFGALRFKDSLYLLTQYNNEIENIEVMKWKPTRQWILDWYCEQNYDVLNLSPEAEPAKLIATDEFQYVSALKEIMLTGNLRPDRTGTGTKSLFNLHMSFDLTEGKLPLMTQRKLSWKNIWAELLFFLRGQTDANILRDQGVGIWNLNSSREFLDRIGLFQRQEYDLGPVYGWQWRHFGARYVDCKTDYTGQGIDQLALVIETLKKDPYSRRLLVSAWNPSDLNLMVLPPCHYSFQFYVEGEYLSCVLNQRSGDMILGIPYNIASYSLLTHIVAHLTGLKASKLAINIGDAHIYCNHFEAAYDMIGLSTADEFPTISFNRKIDHLDDIKFEDVTLNNYSSGPIIKFDMAV